MAARRQSNRRYYESLGADAKGRIAASMAAWRAAHPNRKHNIDHGRRREGERRRYALDPSKFCLKTRARYASKLGSEAKLTRDQWLEILEVFGHRCAYCLRGDQPLTQEHVIPLIRGGAHIAENVVPACLHCNSRKGARPVWSMVA
jgi:5-methylcytosine-specific restriction endonuclease McrA